LSGTPILTHDGATITFVSENSWYAADAVSVSVLYNTGPGIAGTSPLAAQLANIARGQVPDGATAAHAPAGPERFVGFYEGRPGRGVAVTLEDGTLYAQPTDNDKQKLVLQSGTTFTVGSMMSVTITFTAGTGGRIDALILREGTRERIFPRAR
jgi:hypothetical protein